MAPRGFRHRGLARMLLAAANVVLFGCNLGEGYADFGNDLTSPEESIIDGPGTKIADGRFSGMLVDPWGDDGAVVVGFRYLDDGPHLIMQPFDGSEGCDAGLAYRVIVFARLDGEPQLIAYLSEVGSNGRGTLNFVNHSCEIAYGGIKDAELPSRLFDSPPGFVVQAGSQLVDVDPYAGTTRVMTENLQFWGGPGEVGGASYHYFVGDGQLVVFDDQRSELLRLGQDVSEVAFEQSNPYQGLFLVDGDALVRYEPTDDLSLDNVTPETLAEDVCGIALGSYGVSYYSPCASRTLVLKNLSDGTEETIDSDVRRLLSAQSRVLEDGSSAFDVAYTKASEDGLGFEDLWLKGAGAETQVWQSHLGQFLSAGLGASPTLTAVVDSDGTFGRFIRVDQAGETTLYDKVVLGYPVESVSGSWLVMTDLSTQSQGTLRLLSPAGEATVIAEGVPLGGKRLFPERDPELTGVSDESYYGLAALVSDVSGRTGTVGLMQSDDPTTLEPLASGVKTGSAEFFRNMAALGYIDQYDEDAGTGRLVVYQTLLNVGSTVSENVLEYTELLWPWEGVIYTVKVDDEYSLWAARAK